MKIRTNVTPRGMQILLWGIVLLVLVDILDKFGVMKISSFVSPVFIPTIASLFILSEIGIMQLIKGKKKLDGIQAFGLVVAVLALIAVIISIVGVTVAPLAVIQGIISVALGIFVVVEIFKK